MKLHYILSEIREVQNREEIFFQQENVREHFAEAERNLREEELLSGFADIDNGYDASDPAEQTVAVKRYRKRRKKDKKVKIETLNEISEIDKNMKSIDKIDEPDDMEDLKGFDFEKLSEKEDKLEKSNPDENQKQKLSETRSEKNIELDSREMKTAIDDKVTEIEKQELPPTIRDTFSEGKYRTVEAKEDMTLYRVYGGGAKKEGCYLTTQLPEDRMTSKNEFALPQKIEKEVMDDGSVKESKWNNSREYYCEVNIPRGTTLNIGKVKEQYTADGHLLEGGADQVLVSPEFASESKHYQEEHKLEFAGQYPEFSKKAKEIEEGKE